MKMRIAGTRKERWKAWMLALSTAVVFALPVVGCEDDDAFDEIEEESEDAADEVDDAF